MKSFLFFLRKRGFGKKKNKKKKQLNLEPWVTEVNLCWRMCQPEPVKPFWILKGRCLHPTFVHNENYHSTFYNISNIKLFNILKLKIINKTDGTTCGSWTLAENASKINNHPLIMKFVKTSSCDGQKLWPRLLNICLFNTSLWWRRLLLVPIVAFTQWLQCSSDMFEMSTVTPGCCERHLVCVWAHKILINTRMILSAICAPVCGEARGRSVRISFRTTMTLHWAQSHVVNTAVNSKLTHLFYHLSWYLQQ